MTNGLQQRSASSRVLLLGALAVTLAALALLTPLAHATTVSLGDSFSSGEGAGPFDAGTSQESGNGCDRSDKVWPRLLGVPKANHFACSGGSTADFYETSKDPVSQLESDAYIKTKPFVAGRIPFTHAVDYGYAYLVHDATNCSANPWCHQHHWSRPSHLTSTRAIARNSGTAVGFARLDIGDVDSAATTAFGNWIRGRFTEPEGISECPQPQTSDGIVLCLGEFRSEGRWHSVSATAEGTGTEISFIHPFVESWIRRWTPYRAGIIRGFHLPGKASVNGRAAADWPWLAAGAYSKLRRRGSALVNSYDGDSAGFLNLVLFRCRRTHRLMTCRNKLGDAMRYRPHAS